jgi:magnesium transporter
MIPRDPLDDRSGAPAQPDESEDKGSFGVGAPFVERIAGLIDGARFIELRAAIDDLHAADVADLIEQLDPERREPFVDALRPVLDPEVLSHLNPGLREEIVERFEPGELAAAVAGMETDDAVDLIEDLDEDQQREILENLPPEARALVEENLTYAERTAGRLMQRDFVAVPPFWTVGRVLDHIAEASERLPETFYDLFVVDPMHHLVGSVPLARALRARRDARIDDLIDDEPHAVPAAMDQEEVARLFRQYALVSAPVVDASHRLIGMITVDDVVQVIDEEAEEDLLSLGGVGDTGIHRPVVETAGSRIKWLAVNLATAFLASGVISLFEATIEQIVALAVLMPIVASMGGNAGTQTLTIVVRALATREVSDANALRVLVKELAVALLNGIVFAVIVGLIAGLWYGPPIGFVIAAAMIANLFVAGLFGVLIPLGLERLKVDPAVASAVFLTTVTDVVGFFAFLGLAALVLS